MHATDVVVTLAVVAGCLLAAALLARSARRRYRRVRAALADRATTAVDRLTSPGWWTTQALRRRMWRAVGSAERAVREAERIDAAVGDLPLLCRRLRTIADGVDAQLRGSGDWGPGPETVRQADAVISVSRHVNAAAATAVSDTVAPQLGSLVEAIRQECTALAAGSRAARRLG